jgi:hypothetical protein
MVAFKVTNTPLYTYKKKQVKKFSKVYTPQGFTNNQKETKYKEIISQGTHVISKLITRK